MINKFFKYLEARQIYNRTHKELSWLSDKELDDIGICRYDIHTIAAESARDAIEIRNRNRQDYMPVLKDLFTARVNVR